MKLTPQQYEALARLRVSEDFKHLQAVFQEYEDGLLIRLVASSDMPLIYRTQGEILAIRRMREMSNMAPETLRKLQKQEHA